MPAPGSVDIVPTGMTAGGLARRRASLAPQPVLPEIDHKINQKALTVSGETEQQTTLDDMYGGAFMAAVEEDVSDVHASSQTYPSISVLRLTIDRVSAVAVSLV